MRRLEVTCDPEGRLLRIPLDELQVLQGTLKEMSQKDYEDFRELVTTKGIKFSLHVWRELKPVKSQSEAKRLACQLGSSTIQVDDEGKYRNVVRWWLIDGTGRKRMFTKMRDEEGWEIPPLPCVEILAASYEEACEAVLAASSTFHKMTGQGLREFVEKAKLPIAKLEKFALPHIDLPKWKAEFYDTAEPTEKELELYTKKIVAPIYEPKAVNQPAIEELVDARKTATLLEQIEAAPIPEPVKQFLRLAAQRHTVFDYENIAEYYAHAPKEVQNLMEASALVIIDFRAAIENGFTNLSEKIAEAYRRDA